MKKTIVTLLALSGVTLATEFTADTASGILYRNTEGDFVTTAGVEYDSTTHVLTFDDTFAIESENNRILYTLGIVVDMSKVGTLTSNSKVVTTGTGTAMGIGMTTEGKVATVWDNNVPWNNNTTSAITSTELVTLVHSTSGSGSTYMIEGQQFSGDNVGWSWYNLKGSQGGLNSFVINGALESAIVAVGVWKTSATYGGDAVELAAISNTLKTIPEPATATLSLLALAGLAARRRRR